jgi:ornithine cyclodeaminase/alanine dehydrogenase-like protein (mu-crystallin family)
VISLVTNAREPILFADDVRPGTHINAVGAIAPNAVEVDPELLARADHVSVDSPSEALKDLADGGAAEIAIAISDHGLRAEDVLALHTLVSSRPARAADDVTVFKSLGVGLEDVAVAEVAWRRCRQSLSSE